MVKAHAGMHSRNDPLAACSPARVVKVVQVGAVDVGLDLAAGHLKESHSLGTEIDHVELGELLGQKADNLAIRAPERLPRILRYLLSVLPVDTHHIDAADRIPAFAHVGHETHLRAI